MEGCEVIGQGGLGMVYRYDGDSIIKVYRPEVSLDYIKRERECSQLAFTNGLPTAIAFDVVLTSQYFDSWGFPREEYSCAQSGTGVDRYGRHQYRSSTCRTWLCILNTYRASAVGNWGIQGKRKRRSLMHLWRKQNSRFLSIKNSFGWSLKL